MITLFRRIRERLIASGSVTKYLLYAVGEILLVVIGILIALQVNNWNENRKDNERAEQYMSSLKSDLQEDLNMLGTGYDVAFTDSLQLMSHLERLKESNVHPDTVKNILLHEFNYNIRAPRPFNRKTYTTLLSTGDIGLLSDEITQHLVQLVKEQDIKTHLVEGISEAYTPTIIPYYRKYPSEDLPMSVSLIPVTYDDIDMKEMLKEFNVIAALKSLNNQRIMDRQRALAPLTEELINLIDQSINE